MRVLLLLCGLALAQDAVLNDDTVGIWRNHITPTTDELAAERLPWLTTFGDGLRASAAQDKPLLLWMMNGHPLGCT